jgi:alkaline phosphatase D
MAMTLTPERVSNDWVMVDTVKTSSAAASIGHTASISRGDNVMA